MKFLGVAAIALVLMAAPAMAQMGGKRRAGDNAAAASAPKVDDKAYKAALERIPDPKVKYDPWGGVAPAADTAKKK